MEAVIGVVGLSIQVVETAVKIKRVIDSYRSASKDIRRLGTKIDRAEAICRAIETRLKDGTMDSQAASNVQISGPPLLQDIKSTLLELEQILVKLESKATKKGALKSAGMSFLKKKDTIQTLSQDLEEDLNSLHLLMTTDVFSRVEAIHHRVVVVSPPANPETSNANGQQLDQTVSRIMPKPLPAMTTKVESGIMRRSWPLNLYTLSSYTKVTRTSDHTRQQPTTIERRAYSLGHRSFVHRIEFIWQFGTFSPTRCSLHLPDDVNWKDHANLRVDIWATMWRPNVLFLQDLLAEGTISLKTTIDGYSLFEMGMMCLQPETCQFLLQQDPGLVSIDRGRHKSASAPEEGPRTHHPNMMVNAQGSLQGGCWVSPAGLPADDELLPELLAILDLCLPITDPAFLVSEFEFLAPLACSPIKIESCLERYRPYATENWADLINIAWGQVVLLFAATTLDGTLSSYFVGKKLETWSNLIRKLIAEGLDVHKEVLDTHEEVSHPSENSRTALFYLIQKTQCTYTLQVCLEKWAEILQAAGVDLRSYLDWEIPYCEKHFGNGEPYNHNKDWPREFRLEQVSGFTMPAWRRRMKPDGHAFEVRNEFQQLGPFRLRPTSYRLINEVLYHHQPSGRIWKNASQIGWEHDWPFFVPAVNDDLTGLYDNPNWESIIPSYREARWLMEQRFERRQQRKLLKRGQLKKRRRAIMPGSWVEV
ncbi:Fc.00g023460.m01.CDS01 [Cosmosporella sp. VM-42]